MGVIKTVYFIMKLSMTKNSILTVLSCVLFSCKALLDKSDPRAVKLVNHSRENIIFYNTRSTIIDIHNPDIASPGLRWELKVVSKESTGEYELWGTRWEDHLEKFNNKSMIVFVLNYDSVVKYASPSPSYPDSDTTKILKKQFVNMDTLVNNNWTLTYP